MASGALTDVQIWDLAKRMGLDLAFVVFQDDLMAHKLEYDKGYVINLSDQYDKHGKQNEGSHWTGLIVRKYSNGKIAPMYFDPFGVQCPKDVTNFVKNTQTLLKYPIIHVTYNRS